MKLTVCPQSLAEENLTLFMHFFTKGHAALQITALHILTDILTQHGAHVLDSNPALLKVYIKALKSGSKTPDVQASATVSVCKLMLGRVIQDTEACNELLKTLIIAYFDPVNQENQGVLQTLSYFLPVYSYSRQENQDRMRSVAMDVMHSLFNMHEALDGDDEDAEMVSLGTIGAHLVDWTDPRKCYVPGDNIALADESSKKAINGDVHLHLARDILERLNTNITSKIPASIPVPLVLCSLIAVTEDEKKILAPLLGKLHISPTSTEDKLRDLYGEVSTAIADKLITDTTGRNALYKIHVSLGKIVNSLIEKEKHVHGQGRKSVLPETGRKSATPEEKTVLLDRVGENEDERTEIAPRGARGRPKKIKKEVVEEEVEDIGEEIIVCGANADETKASRDSLVSELLSDDDSDL
jgi:condensin complex subunit 3